MKTIKVISLVNILICFNIFVQGQNFENLNVISSGGEIASGNNYSNLGIIGETFVNNSVSGGNYMTTIGFIYSTKISVGIFKNNDNTAINIFPNPFIFE